MTSTLVVMPAREGSKRIPGKNIKSIAGCPMIRWPLRVLLSLFSCSDILVSTDSQEIKSVVESMGVRVPFMRPKKLADDYTPTFDVVAHALNWFESHVRAVDFVLTVYPTAVFISECDLVRSFDMMGADESCDVVVSAAAFGSPIQRAYVDNKMGYAEMLQPENYLARSQDLEPAFYDAGQFYLSKSRTIRNLMPMVESNIRLCKIPAARAVDIDTLEDFEMAERLLLCGDHQAWSQKHL